MKKPRAPQLPASPQSPLEAFQQFAETVRNSPPILEEAPEYFLSLLRPFLANSARNEAHVALIAEAYAAARVTRSLPFLKLVSRFGLRRMAEQSPRLLQRLRELEDALKTELVPGSVTLHVKPIRYLETPTGFGGTGLRRYRIEIQTLVEESGSDQIEAVAVEIKADVPDAVSLADEVVVDRIWPEPAFAALVRKQSSGAQRAQKVTVGSKQSTGGELAGAGQKLSATGEISRSEEESVSTSEGLEETVNGVRQYFGRPQDRQSRHLAPSGQRRRHRRRRRGIHGRASCLGGRLRTGSGR